jgi:hypothetical protein
LGWGVLSRFSPLYKLGFGWMRQGESLCDSKAIQYMGGLGVVIVGPSLYSYYVRELLAFLVLFAGAFLVLLLAVLGIYLVWYSLVKVAMWTPPASRSVIAFSRRFIAAHAKA